MYKTHVEEYYETVVQNEQDSYYYFKEHRLLNTNANLKALRSSFVNKLIENIRSQWSEAKAIVKDVRYPVDNMDFCGAC